MVFVFGGALAFFFEFLLLSKKNKSLSDKILIFWMFAIGVHLFLFYMSMKGIDLKYPFFLGINEPLPLIHGPLLFLYTSSLMGISKKWKMKYFLHFLPILVFFIHYFKFFLYSDAEKISFIKKMTETPDLFFTMIFPSILISGFTYITFTFILFRKHRKNILNNLSNSNEKNNLHWLRNLIIGLLFIWVVVFVSDFVVEGSYQSKIIYFSVVLFVISIGYFGIRQGNIFVNAPIINIENINEKDPARYTKSGLKEEQAIELQKKLIEIMEINKLFLEENLSLPQLAGLLNVHPNYLSQVINEKFQKNFYDFVNFYRIMEFKKLVTLKANKKITFYALANDCGFNSKASFNNSFKKFTGLTPSEYVKSQSLN